MLSSFQPSRPKLNQTRPQAPMNQQPIQRFHTMTATTSASSSIPQSQAQAQVQPHPYPHPPLSLHPRNQLEAMPVSSPPSPAIALAPIPSPSTTRQQPQPPQRYPRPTLAAATASSEFDASTRHPVFFTQRLKRPPSGVGAGGWVSPVAMGYIFDLHRGTGPERGAGMKL